jgi:hypothetical protein
MLLLEFAIKEISKMVKGQKVDSKVDQEEETSLPRIGEEKLQETLKMQMAQLLPLPMLMAVQLMVMFTKDLQEVDSKVDSKDPPEEDSVAISKDKKEVKNNKVKLPLTQLKHVLMLPQYQLEVSELIVHNCIVKN